MNRQCENAMPHASHEWRGRMGRYSCPGIPEWAVTPSPLPAGAGITRTPTLTDHETKPCALSGTPHEPHTWSLAGIDGDVYWCPGVNEPGSREEWMRPEHYGGEENPFEPIKIIEYYGLNFSLGNAVKYILRTGKKQGEPDLKELRKAATYIGFEIRRRERMGEDD